MSIKMYFVALALIVCAFDQTFASQMATMEGIGPVARQLLIGLPANRSIQGRANL